VAKTNVYLTDGNDWPSLNDAYVAFFDDPRPARSTVVVASLLGDAVVEVDAIAHLG
jgi:2-iminobutanoate/2-iminopropanoate deaminase